MNKLLFLVSLTALATFVFAGGDPGLEINIRTLDAQIKAEITQLNSTGYGNLCLNLVKYQQALEALLKRAEETDEKSLLELLRREYNDLKNNANREISDLQRDLQTLQDLKLKTATLKARIAADLATLKLYNMTSHIEILTIDEQRLDMLMGDLKNVTQVATVRHLEDAIKEVENHVNKDLEDAERDLRNIHHFYVQERIGSTLFCVGDAELLTKILTLESLLKVEISRLESIKLGALGDNLANYLTQAQTLEKQYESTLDSHIHHVILVQYMLLEREVKREIEAVHKDKVSIHDLQRNAAMLDARLTSDINLLSLYNMPNEVNVLQIAKTRLDSLIAEIEKASDVTTVRYLEMSLRKLEIEVKGEAIKIERKLRKVDHIVTLSQVTLDDTDVDVKGFIEEVNDEIQHLNATGHQQLTSNLVGFKHQAEELERRLERLNGSTSQDASKEMQAIAAELTKLKHDFAEEVKQLKTDAPAIDVLRARAKNLLFAIQTDIELLKGRNLTDEAAKLQIDADRIEVLNKDLEQEHNVEGVRYLETLLRAIEKDISDKLQKLEDELMKPETFDIFDAELTLQVNLDEFDSDFVW